MTTTTKIIISFFLTIFWFNCVYSQADLEAGIGHLNKGEYHLASSILSKVYQENPKNKTAGICLARALGLAGSHEEALEVLHSQIVVYPDDKEIMLNMAEVQLWMKDYPRAIQLFQEIIDKSGPDPNVFLGLANAQAAAQDYVSAHTNINKVINFEQNNEQAMLSKKSIDLALANMYANRSDFKSAKKILSELEIIFLDDKDIIISKAITYLKQNKPNKARFQYLKLINFNTSVLMAYEGLSYCHLLLGQKKRSLEFAQLAEKKGIETNSPRLSEIKSNLAFIYAVNENFEKSDSIYQIIDKETPTDSRLITSRARAEMLNDNTNLAIEELKKHIELSPSYDFLICAAELEKNNRNNLNALKYLEKAVFLNPGNNDGKKFLQSVRSENSMKLVSGIKYAFDNGNNSSHEMRAGIHWNRWNKLVPYGGINLRKMANRNLDESTTITSLTTGAEYLLNRKLIFNGQFGFNAISGSMSRNSMISSLGLVYTPSNKSRITASFEVQDFDYSIDLLDTRIKLMNGRVQYAHLLPLNFGFYSNFECTSQSDGNRRYLAFGSLYHTIPGNLYYKFGLNYSHIKYQDVSEKAYFNPEQFHSTEIFIESFNQKGRGKLDFNVQVALGIQQIENNPMQLTHRFRSEVGYNHGNFRFLFNAELSNSRSSNIAGYSYQSYSLSCVYNFVKN
ncbi:MAG: hypothetical protein KJO29_09385 [Bacteroidia bacterium]|nr:hypothetical protein [Bacteroidia bacterium]